MNIFDDNIMLYKINVSINSGEDSTYNIIKKNIGDFKKEINRVKSLSYYRGEDNYIINDIENIIRKKYTKYLLNIFFTIVRLKIICIKFKKKKY